MNCKVVNCRIYKNISFVNWRLFWRLLGLTWVQGLPADCLRVALKGSKEGGCIQASLSRILN